MKVKWMAVLLVIGLLSSSIWAADVAPDDAKAIKESVTNYLGGWFSSDPDRMRKALHPNLSKYTVKTIQGSQLEYLDGIDAESLIAFAAHNQEWVKGKRYHEMKIVYQDERFAVVHAVSDGFYDVCGLVKLNAEWKILHVLWDVNDLGPESK
jgi:hypothetical protein